MRDWGGWGEGGLGPKTVNIDIFINLQDLPQYLDTTELDKHDNEAWYTDTGAEEQWSFQTIFF